MRGEASERARARGPTDHHPSSTHPPPLSPPYLQREKLGLLALGALQDGVHAGPGRRVGLHRFEDGLGAGALWRERKGVVGVVCGVGGAAGAASPRKRRHTRHARGVPRSGPLPAHR